MTALRLSCLPLLVACTRGPAIGDFEVASARLEGPRLTTVAVVVGTVQGRADLVIEDVDGGVHEVPVHLGGGLVGGPLDIAADPIAGTTELDLSDADQPVLADHLLGTYSGTASGITVGGGITYRSLKNGHGVKLRELQFTVGLGAITSTAWLRLRATGDVVSDDADTADTSQ